MPGIPPLTKSRGRTVVILGVVLPVVFTLLAYWLLPHFRWVNIRLNSWLDELEAAIGLILTALLILARRQSYSGHRWVPVVGAIFSVSVIAGVRSAVDDLPVEIWLYNFSALFGSLLFGMVLVQSRLERWISIRVLTVGLSSLSLIMACSAVMLPDWFPLSVSHVDFTTWSKTIYFLSGVLYFSSAFKLFKLHRHLKDDTFFFFATLALYFGSVVSILPFCHVWGPRWWLLQIFGLVPFALSLRYIFVAFGQNLAMLLASERNLRTTAKALSYSNAELERFSYIASHDLKSPLNTIRNYSILIGRRLKNQEYEDVPEFLEFITGAVDRMANLIDDLLLLSKVTKSKSELTPVDCQRLVQGVLANLHLDLEQARAEVTSDPLPSVLGDRTQLFQLFQNLVANAIKFRGQSNPVVHIGVEREQKKWRFSVKDNGIGIDGEGQTKIFNAFQRLHSTNEFPGTGLGLTICKTVVERHGGQIWVESSPQQGATFFFTLAAAL